MYKDVKDEGSIEIPFRRDGLEQETAYNDRSRSDAIELATEFIDHLLEIGYDCLIREEESIIVVDYNYTQSKADEYCSPRFVTLSPDEIEEVCDKRHSDNAEEEED